MAEKPTYEELEKKVNELVQTETELRKSEAHYRQLFDFLPYGGEILDSEGKITNCSLNTAKMMGYKREEVIGKHITDFVDADTV